MIKVTALALFIALCNAEKETESNGPSRLLLQFNAPPQQQQPGFGGGYNPYGGILNSPMCQYDPQNCIDMLQNMYQNPGFYPPPQQYYNPYPQYPQYPPPQQYPQPVPQQPQVQPPPISQPPANGAPAPPQSGNPAPAGPVDPATNPGAPAVNPGLNPPPPPQSGVPQQGPAVIGQPGQQLPAVQPPMGQPPMNGVPGGMPGLVPGMPAMLGPPVTDINCGPPPATMCAGRNAMSPLGPLNLGANLANNAKLYCDTPGVCSNSIINMDIRPNPANPGGVRAINQILCSEPGSCGGTTANIKNLQGNGNNIELSNLECGAPGACNGFILNGWGVSLNDVNCAVMADCMGCIFNNMKTAPDAFCADPFAPNAPSNPNCIIESIPCFGY